MRILNPVKDCLVAHWFNSAYLCVPLRLCGYCTFLNIYRRVAEIRRDTQRTYFKPAHYCCFAVSRFLLTFG
jgi:hypothetical protein